MKPSSNGYTIDTLPKLVDVACGISAFLFIWLTTSRTFDGYSLLLFAFIFSLIASFAVNQIIHLNRTKSRQQESKSSNNLLALRFPGNVLLCILCIVAMNKYIPIESTIHLKARLNDKSYTKYRGTYRSYVDLHIDDHGEQQLRLKRKVWNSLQVGDEINVTAQKGLLGYYIVSEVKKLNSKN